MNFEKGQNVNCTIYHGVSKVEADVTYNALQESKKEKRPFPLTGSGFSILITQVSRRTTPGSDKYDTIHEISMKGELI